MRGGCSDFGVCSSTSAGLGDPCYQVILPEGAWGLHCTSNNDALPAYTQLEMLFEGSQPEEGGSRAPLCWVKAKAPSQGCQRCVKEINSPFRVPQSWFPCISYIAFIPHVPRRAQRHLRVQFKPLDEVTHYGG